MLNKYWSNTFSLTAQSILGLTVARENMVVLSRGLSAPRDEKNWCSTLDPDGWRRCQSSLCSGATALSSVCLYLDKVATFHEIEMRCSFKAFIDSTSAISNAVSIRDLIPKRQYPNNADCMTTIKDSSRVISHMCLQHVRSHQNTKTNFDKLPLAAQLNTICDGMAWLLGIWNSIETANGRHKASHCRPGTCQYNVYTNSFVIFLSEIYLLDQCI